MRIQKTSNWIAWFQRKSWQRPCTLYFSTKDRAWNSQKISRIRFTKMTKSTQKDYNLLIYSVRQKNFSTQDQLFKGMKYIFSKIVVFCINFANLWKWITLVAQDCNLVKITLKGNTGHLYFSTLIHRRHFHIVKS